MTETILTENDLRTWLRGERDSVGYEPYRVGDRLVRCGYCRMLVKAEYVSDGNRCPLCGHAPFLTAQTVQRPAAQFPPRPTAQAAQRPTTRPVQQPAAVTARRGLGAFLLLLMLSTAASSLPLQLDVVQIFMQRIAGTLNFPIWWFWAYTGVVSVITMLVVYNSYTCRSHWQYTGPGVLLVLLPFAMPYLIILAVMLVILGITICCFLVCLILLMVFASIFEG